MSIESVYQSLLRRNPDPGAYGTYAGWSDEDIANAIYGSQEFANLQQQSQPQQQQPQEQPYTPGPSYGDYNFAMTGKPSDAELAGNPDMANAWYAYSGTSPSAPTTPPSWLNPADYVANKYEAPYTPQQISKQVDPSWIRQMNGQTYASVKGPSDLSGGEYLVDPNTGKFILDKNGNPVGVTYPKSNNFDDWATTPLGGLALTFGVPLAAAGGIAALEGLGVLGGAGEGALTTADILGSTGFTPAAGSGASFSLIPGGVYTAGTLGGLTTADILASTGFTPAAGSGANFAIDPNAAYTAAAAAAAPSLAKALGTGLGTASTLAKLLGSGASLFGSNNIPSGYLPSALRGTLPGTGTTGSTPIQIGAGSNQSPLPGVYQEQFAPYVFGNQQPVQTPRGGNYDFMAALNKPVDTSVLGQMKNVSPTNSAQNQAQNAKLNFFSSLFA